MFALAVAASSPPGANIMCTALSGQGEAHCNTAGGQHECIWCFQTQNPGVAECMPTSTAKLDNKTKPGFLTCDWPKSGAFAPSAPKVNVEIMVESFCPCSGAWEAGWAKDLAPQIGNISQLSRFFDAKKNGTQGCCNPSASINATCMHGKGECVADSLQRCVQAHYPAPARWLEYTNCISGPCDRPDPLGCKFQFDIGTAKNLPREQACAQNLSMSWTKINDCWQGAEGVQLMQRDADKSDSMESRYGMVGLPVVWVDGKLLSHFFDCDVDKAAYQQSLVKAICDASTAVPLPDACKSP